ncbi:hypothetical protein SKAU_G00224840 [Synaphobranchus kaupii]|uniref:Uncharacterized protein n=1 Tax=Synaphobranchus kaupii TaxID=118154 RepID=A0A9Q1IVC5_SYNKA|nr:hypothetical protein SKAU_G00224840 [Synaphobranchus kaupii]
MMKLSGCSDLTNGGVEQWHHRKCVSCLSPQPFQDLPWAFTRSGAFGLWAIKNEGVTFQALYWLVGVRRPGWSWTLVQSEARQTAGRSDGSGLRLHWLATGCNGFYRLCRCRCKRIL